MIFGVANGIISRDLTRTKLQIIYYKYLNKMTPIETKANEYAQTLHPIGIDEVSVIVRDFYAGYTEALRWRDVNVELPPFENVPINERTKYIVKVCTGSMTPKVDIRIWSLSNHRRWIGEMDWVSVTHWRPIETI